jgi:hypothetical protein
MVRGGALAMRSAIPAAAILAALGAAPAVARAGPELALRLGVAPAVGSAAADVDVADAIPLQFPIQLDALWRAGSFGAGVYGSWGPARAGQCGSGATCSASVARVGIQAPWTFRSAGRMEPWLGLAAGYEWARSEETRSSTLRTTYSGFEPIAVQGGVEWRLARWFAAGPYVLLGLGRYTRYSVDTGFDAGSTDIPAPAFHLWFHGGVRARFVLGGGR